MTITHKKTPAVAPTTTGKTKRHVQASHDQHTVTGHLVDHRRSNGHHHRTLHGGTLDRGTAVALWFDRETANLVSSGQAFATLCPDCVETFNERARRKREGVEALARVNRRNTLVKRLADAILADDNTTADQLVDELKALDAAHE